MLSGKKEKREKILDTNVMLCYLYKPKAGKYTDIVSVYQLVFSSFYGDMMMTHTHTRIVRTGDLKACMIEKKNIRRVFLSYICSSTFFLPILFEERTND